MDDFLKGFIPHKPKVFYCGGNTPKKQLASYGKDNAEWMAGILDGGNAEAIDELRGILSLWDMTIGDAVDVIKDFGIPCNYAGRK
jgi:hypothetical protein